MFRVTLCITRITRLNGHRLPRLQISTTFSLSNSTSGTSRLCLHFTNSSPSSFPWLRTSTGVQSVSGKSSFFAFSKRASTVTNLHVVALTSLAIDCSFFLITNFILIITTFSRLLHRRLLASIVNSRRMLT